MRWRRAVVGCIAAATLLPACSSGGGKASTDVHVSALSSLTDAFAGFRVSGLRPGQSVVLSTATVDGAGVRWSAQGTFVADSNGGVDTSRQAPTTSGYSGVDAAGLLWSMQSNPKRDYFQPPSDGRFRVTLTVVRRGHDVAHQAISEYSRLPAVQVTQLRRRTDSGLVGAFYSLPGAQRRPAILTFGGSEGGQSQDEIAGLLASHGYPTLSLAYFGEPGLPAHLTDIRLEYFAAALRWLAEQPSVDPHRIWVRGGSRGSEAALLVGADYPGLVHGVIAAAPSSVANVAPPPDTAQAAWTWQGKPVPTVPVAEYKQVPTPVADRIPVARITGPVITICGQSDEVWPSCAYSQEIVAARAGRSRVDQDLSYADAGHYAGLLVPNQPLGNFSREGGSGPGLERSLQDSLQHLLAVLSGSDG